MSLTLQRNNSMGELLRKVALDGGALLGDCCCECNTEGPYIVGSLDPEVQTTQFPDYVWVSAPAEPFGFLDDSHNCATDPGWTLWDLSLVLVAPGVYQPVIPVGSHLAFGRDRIIQAGAVGSCALIDYQTYIQIFDAVLVSNGVNSWKFTLFLSAFYVPGNVFNPKSFVWTKEETCQTGTFFYNEGLSSDPRPDWLPETISINPI